MKLEKGFRLGKFEIERIAGRGGMGEVYLAHDRDLNRQVAIKFLSSEFGSDEKLRNRFMQEIRSVSALNHPHILTVFEFGKLERENDTLHYFVSEFVVGETLRSFLETQKIGLGVILEIVTQIASALVSAHEAGIVHRDLKPENVMIRPDGYVKILDFGLAKPIDKDPSIDPEAATKLLTNPGTVMGTVSYMSPEQARGESVDAQTDIWSLGVLLYEMITGRLPFEGETASHTIVSILERQPPRLSEYVLNVPESLQFVVDELLVKDRDERCQTARELLGKLKRLKHQIDVDAEIDREVRPNVYRSTNDEIQRTQQKQHTDAQVNTTNDSESSEARSRSGAQVGNERGRKKRARAAFAIALGSLVIAGVTLATFVFFKGFSNNSNTSEQTLKLTRITNNGQSHFPAVSPDGKQIAFVYSNAGKRSLRLRQISTASFIDLVPELDGNFLGATFSRDGNDVYYVAGERDSIIKSLYRVSTLGGISKKVLEDVDGGIDFSPDGKKIVFLRVRPNERKKILFIVNLDGSAEERIIERPIETSIKDVAWSPNGKTIAFSYFGHDPEGYFVHVYGFDLDTKKEIRITRERWRNIPSIAWLRDNSAILIAGRDFASIPGSPNQIWKIPFPSGTATRLTNDLNNYSNICVDRNSQNLITEISNLNSSLWIFPQSDPEQARQITSKSVSSGSVSWTPDGRILHTSNEGGNNDLWVISSSGDEKNQLTSDAAFETDATATRDGKYIVYETNRNVGWSIWRMNSDGSDQKEIVGNVGRSFPKTSPDSLWIIYSKNEGSIWRVSVEGGDPELVIRDRVFGHDVSPDGSHIAYISRSNDSDEAYMVKIAPIEGKGSRKLIDSFVYDDDFKWSPDGKHIDFVKTKNKVSDIWRIPTEGGKPRTITKLESEGIMGFSWSPDGRQIAVARGNSDSDLVLIENFQ